MPMLHKKPGPIFVSDAIKKIAEINSVSFEGAQLNSAEEALEHVIKATRYTDVFKKREFESFKEKVWAVAEATGCSGLIGPLKDDEEESQTPPTPPETPPAQ